ncbi:MAG: TauD/TfdA family dioxygenase [Betaproteobacteria bacterium]|nr:TauD/TfdA family dioxygenase [Betaproteobacteria bacterium]
MPGPFDLEDARAYRAWRAQKLERNRAQLEAQLVEIADPHALSAPERAALLTRCSQSNFAVYACPPRAAARQDAARMLAAQLGLARLDRHHFAEDDGVSAITPGGGRRGEFIPYTDRAIGWHTDGYYNPAVRRIRAMTLHCVRDALEGGESALLDHEVAYILLRDEDPDLIRALSAPDALIIPPRLEGEAVARAAGTGPVFSVDPGDGKLHMRYTARGVNIAWKDDRATSTARAALEHVLQDASPWILRLRLAPGMGIVCNNVLHARSAFRDAPEQHRLLYRVRSYDRIAEV